MFKKIIATVAASPEGQRAVQVAMELASDAKAELHIVLLTPPRGAERGFSDLAGPDVAHMLDNDEEHSLDATRSRVEQDGQARGYRVHSHQLEEQLVEATLELARTENADLLIVGLRRERIAVSRLWSKIDEAAHNTPCCILGVP